MVLNTRRSIMPAGIPTSIEEIPVTSTPFVTGPIWNMGNPGLYAPGTYTYWAECNVNRMNDNYNVEGKTISRKSTLLNQGANPLISTATTIPATKHTESNAGNNTDNNPGKNPDNASNNGKHNCANNSAY